LVHQKYICMSNLLLLFHHSSTLTLGILRRRYLEKVGRESLSTKDRQLMKKIVEEELLKMQVTEVRKRLMILPSCICLKTTHC